MTSSSLPLLNPVEKALAVVLALAADMPKVAVISVAVASAVEKMSTTPVRVLRISLRPSPPSMPMLNARASLSASAIPTPTNS